MTEDQKLETLEEYTKQNPFNYNVDALVEELLSEAKVTKGTESYFDRSYGNWVPGDPREYDGPEEDEILKQACKEAVNDFMYENNLVNEYKNINKEEMAECIIMKNGNYLKDEIYDAINHEMERVWER